MLAASTEILSRHSDASIVDMPYVTESVLANPPYEVFHVIYNTAVLCLVKVEKLDPIIELSSELEGESPNLTLPKQTHSNEVALDENVL